MNVHSTRRRQMQAQTASKQRSKRTQKEALMWQFDRQSALAHCSALTCVAFIVLLLCLLNLPARASNEHSMPTSDTEHTLIEQNTTQSAQNNTQLTNTTNTNNNQTDASQASDSGGIMMRSSIIINALIFIVGLCGNLSVIVVILKFTRVETVTDIYILNLAFADLMFVTGLVFLITTMTLDHWIFGNIMCKLYMATTSLNQFASSLLLVVMSFDRFLAVCHPIYAQRFRLPHRAKIVCLSIWIICLILMTPIFAFAKISPELTCAIFWPDNTHINCEIAFTVYSFAIGFALPLLLIAAFYLCVIRKLRQSAREPIRGMNAQRLRNRECANKRIEHLVIGIIFTYTFCWLPYWIEQLFVSFSTGEWVPPNFYLFVLIATSLSYTNSALNPILYAFLSDNFKRRFTAIFRSACSIRWLPCNCLSNRTSSKTSQSSAPVNSCGVATSATNLLPSTLAAGDELAARRNSTSRLNVSVQLTTCDKRIASSEYAPTSNKDECELMQTQQQQATNKSPNLSVKAGERAINAHQHQHQSRCQKL